MRTAVAIVGIGVAGFLAWRVFVAMSAGVSVGAALKNPTKSGAALAVATGKEKRANTGAGHF
jgi:hypothetical protein